MPQPKYHVAPNGELKSCRVSRNPCRYTEYYSSLQEFEKHLSEENSENTFSTFSKEESKGASNDCIVTVEDASGDLIELTPVVIDENAEWLYFNGQCLALATSISRRTGWAVYAIFEKEEVFDSEEYDGLYEDSILRHAGVITPDGKFLDISGVRDLKEAGGFEEDERVIYSSDRVDELLSDQEGFLSFQDTEISDTFVDSVLKFSNIKNYSKKTKEIFKNSITNSPESHTDEDGSKYLTYSKEARESFDSNSESFQELSELNKNFKNKYRTPKIITRKEDNSETNSIYSSNGEIRVDWKRKNKLGKAGINSYRTGDLNTDEKLLEELVMKDPRHDYFHGDCVNLALDIYRENRDEVVGVSEMVVDGEETGAHYVARLKDGSYVDALGRWSKSGLHSAWSELLKIDQEKIIVKDWEEEITFQDDYERQTDSGFLKIVSKIFKD